MLAIERFGASAPSRDIFSEFGFTVEHVADLARGVLIGRTSGVVSPEADHVAPADPIGQASAPGGKGVPGDEGATD